MHRTLICCTLILFSAGIALAGNGYDRCIKEEKNLKSKEADNCSGLKYLFNPSGCFAAQRVLKEQSAKCAEIARSEKPDAATAPVVVPVVPEKMNVAAPTPAPAAKIIAEPVGTAPDTTRTAETASHPAAAPEQYKDENARLKAEIERLKAENQRLKKGGQ